MKKKWMGILCIVLVGVLFSCDNSSEHRDPIVGKWEYVTGTINGILNTSNDCQPYITTFQNNTLGTITTYKNGSTDCVVDTNSEFNWTKTSSGHYEITFTNPNGIIVYDWTPLFSSNNNIVTLTRSYYDTNTLVLYEYMVQFQRK